MTKTLVEVITKTMETRYISFDGLQFCHEKNCRDYELEHLSTIKEIAETVPHTEMTCDDNSVIWLVNIKTEEELKKINNFVSVIGNVSIQKKDMNKYIVIRYDKNLSVVNCMYD